MTGHLVSNRNEKLKLFADDSKAFVIHNNMPELKDLAQELICKLCEWFQANKLTLNWDKSNFSIVHPPRKKIPDEFNTFNVDGVIIDRLHHVKYLGTFLDDNTKLESTQIIFDKN